MNTNVNVTHIAEDEVGEKYRMIRTRLEIISLIAEYNELAKKYELPTFRVISNKKNASFSPVVNMDGVGYIGKKDE